MYGDIISTSRSDSASTISIQALSRLGKLNIYNVQTYPFSGTFKDAVTYYISLSGASYDIYVDPSLANKAVSLPGWNGELWYNLKQLAVAMQCDISMVNGVITFMPVRSYGTERGKNIERSVNAGGGTLAQFIEVYCYNNKPITNELVYPPGGWNEDVTVINVNAGETIEEVIELSASVSSVEQPVMVTSVTPDYRASSVYTVVGDDGLPINPVEWAAKGGSLTVTINPDTTSLTVTITAPKDIANKSAEFISVYSISLNDGEKSVRYSTLRIRGTGVAFDKQLLRISTGVTPSETGTEVGVTIDNPFLSTPGQAYDAGFWAVKSYDGSGMGTSGSVMELLPNPNGDIVQSYGKLAGSRVWDQGSKRWYRIRDVSVTPESINFEADDDLTWNDLETYWT